MNAADGALDTGQQVVELRLAQLSISMEHGIVARWLVDDGTEVLAGQPVVEIDTDKATVEVEAPGDGVLQIIALEGTTVAVDGVLATVGSPVTRSLAPAPASHEQTATHAQVEVSTPGSPIDSYGVRAAASPAARRIAAIRGVDLASLSGSGPGGRIIARDVPEAATAEPSPADTRSGAPSSANLRAAIVEGLTTSWQQVPHIQIGGRLNAEGLMTAHRYLRDARQHFTVTDLLMFVLTRALRSVPELNGQIAVDGTFMASRRIDLSIAVATTAGVVAPLVKDAGSLSLTELAHERQRLVTQARAGTLERRDLATGSFTLSNLGAYPVDFFAPIVSSPQVATLATGRITNEVIADGDWIGSRPRMWANVAIDHRAADGDAGARFLGALESEIGQLSGMVVA
jgi:pyruvate dehydrogenase E2 component (dihydrolipoyllysine-residue acetyltransferase)